MVGEMDHDLGSVVSAAAKQTMRGAVHVTVSWRASIPDFDGGADCGGIADFDADRCRLDAQADADELAMVFDGPVAYMRQADGRWTWTKGAPGTHNMFDPRSALEALVHAQRSAVAAATDVVELTLDYETLSAGSDIGLAPDWDESIAVVQLLPSGTIARVTLTHRSQDDPDAWMRLDYQITKRAAPGQIDLPKSETTISLEQYTVEQMEGEHNR